MTHTVRPWRCQRSGACCRPPSLVMTHAERAEIEAVSASTPLLWAPHPDVRFVALVTTGGCPFLRMVEGRATCAVYAVRPYNCRRFTCVDQTDRTGRRTAQLYQRKAQRWALAHGWSA